MPLLTNIGMGDVFYTVQQLDRFYQMGITGFRFAILRPPPAAPGTFDDRLGTHSMTPVARGIGLPAGVSRSYGLMTCASVIYVVPNASFFVHHANAGHVAPGLAQALAALGVPPGAVWVVYAHPGPSDSHYASDVASLVAAGIPAAQIFEIEQLQTGSFGMDNHGCVGH